jgi:AcrR family transcriptional regulator
MLDAEALTICDTLVVGRHGALSFGMAGRSLRLPLVIATVRSGVFFEVPVVLPRGRHGLAREQVLAAQRERLMASMTELMAAHGYREVKVGEVAARAGVSRAAFYDCYADKEACAFAAYDRFIEVLLGRLAATERPEYWDGYMTTLLEAYLGTLQQDLVVARAFQVEMDAVGREARERRRSALVRFAEFVRGEHERLAAGDPRLRPLPASAYLGVVYAARQIASDALDAEPQPDLLSLVPELGDWMNQLLGPSERPVDRGGLARRRAVRS